MSTEQTNEITRTLLSYVEDFSAAYLAAAEKFAAQWAEILPQEAVGEDADTEAAAGTCQSYGTEQAGEPEPTEPSYSWVETASAFSPAFSDEEIDHRFLYHPPTDERVRGTHNRVRNIAQETAKALNEVVPAGREASLMMTALEEAEFWANAAVARNHDAVIAIWEAQHG